MSAQSNEALSRTAYIPESRTSLLGMAGRGLLRFLRRKPLGAFGLLVVVTVVSLAVLAPTIAPYSYSTQQLRNRLEGPSPEHWLGTDSMGRDILSRILYGSQVAVMVGFGAVIVNVTIASTMGVTSGYMGGGYDKLFQRIVDIWLSLPGLVVLITILGLMGSGVPQLIVTIGILGAAGPSRLVRSAVLSVMANQYIEAAQVIGASSGRIMLRYVLPNVMPIILYSATTILGGVILIEASLSFLGYGVPPPFPSWGQMLSGEGREYMRRAPGLAIWPGAAIAVTVFGFTVLGDALRDVLDPRLRGSR